MEGFSNCLDSQVAIVFVQSPLLIVGVKFMEKSDRNWRSRHTHLQNHGNYKQLESSLGILQYVGHPPYLDPQNRSWRIPCPGRSR